MYPWRVWITRTAVFVRDKALFILATTLDGSKGVLSYNDYCSMDRKNCKRRIWTNAIRINDMLIIKMYYYDEYYEKRNLFQTFYTHTSVFLKSIDNVRINFNCRRWIAYERTLKISAIYGGGSSSSSCSIRYVSWVKNFQWKSLGI